MVYFARLCAIACLLAWPALPAPPLTTIQDTLYKADGTAFNGTVFIEWKSFAASDNSAIQTHSVTVQVVNGVLRVQLVPTTNAVPAATYSVRYNSSGRIQFEETWAVPPSATPLRLRDVRTPVSTAPGTVTPPPALETEIQESDVVGLINDLAIRPVKGVGFGPGRAASIGPSGEIEAVIGNMTDCVRVDGTAGPCGMGGPGFTDGETPAGVVDGSNPTFTLSNAPAPAESLTLYRNGLLQKPGVDFTLSGDRISFLAAATPQPGDVLTASYRLPEGTGGAVPAPTRTEVLCSGTGIGTSAATLARLGNCGIPAYALQTGDRVEVRFDFSHEGTAADFAFEVRWGGTTLASRSPGAAESVVTGRAEGGVYAGGTQWSVQTWGSTMSLSAGAMKSDDSLASPLSVDFLGRMASTTAETVTLRNYTVVRIPAR